MLCWVHENTPVARAGATGHRLQAAATGTAACRHSCCYARAIFQPYQAVQWQRQPGGGTLPGTSRGRYGFADRRQDDKPGTGCLQRYASRAPFVSGKNSEWLHAARLEMSAMADSSMRKQWNEQLTAFEQAQARRSAALQQQVDAATLLK